MGEFKFCYDGSIGYTEQLYQPIDWPPHIEELLNLENWDFLNEAFERLEGKKSNE